MSSLIRWLIGLGLLMALAGAGMWAVRIAPQKRAAAPIAAGSVILPSDVATAVLHSPSGDATKTGVATRQFVDVVFAHGVTASLPDLPPDQFYAGWLVKAADPTHPLPTGKFTKDSESWILSYSRPTDESSYDGVLVSVQTNEDQSLGPIVLEGTFLSP